MLSQHPSSCQVAFLGDSVSQHLRAQSLMHTNHVCERDVCFSPHNEARPPSPLGSVANSLFCP